MNFKTTYIFFGILIALLGVAAFTLLTGPKPGSEGLLLANLKSADVTADKVTRVTVERTQPTETKLVFARDGKQWKLEKPYPAKLDSQQVDRVVGDFLNARTETKGTDLTGSLSNFGLDNPSMSVTLDTEGGRSETVYLGNVTVGSPETALVYVTSSENPKTPAALKRSSLGGLFRTDVTNPPTAGDLLKSVTDFRSKDLILEDTFTPADVVTSIKLKSDKGEVALKKSSGGGWEFEKPEKFGEADTDGDTLASTSGTEQTPSGVKPLLTAIKNIRAVSNQDFIENVTDFAQYGLEPGKEAARIEVVRPAKSGGEGMVTEVLLIGKKEENGNRVFVRPGGEAVVVKVDDGLIEPIRKVIEKPSSLRSRSFAPQSVTQADGIDVQVGNDPPVELRKVGEPASWKLFDAQGHATNANATAVTSLLNELSGRRLVKEFPDPTATDAALGLDKPAATVSIWVNGIVPEEKKEEKKDEKKDEAKDKAKDESKDKAKDKDKDKSKDAANPEEKKEPTIKKPKMQAEPTVKLLFGKRDKDLLYVRRIAGTTKADMAVPDSLLAKVTRGRIDYVDPTLPSFTRDQTEKLTFNRGAETFVIERTVKEGAKGPTWEVKKPDNYSGRTADEGKVEQIVGELSGLRAERLWAEKPTDRELERAGLKPPKVEVTVGLKDDKDKPRVYQFGAETDDKTGVYAKQGGRDLVFVVRKQVVDAIEQGELLDPTVFRLDLSKVQGIKLTGWKDVVGNEMTLDMERKGTNNWSMKGTSTFKLSAPQAESFLSGLTYVRADKFVVFKSGPKPEHKLTPAEGALKIEITVDGEKEPIMLSIGAPDADGKSYYAQSSKLPGDVFLVPKEKFEKWKSRPTVFSAE
ncbi:MAG TPA: DUF4340 domain-containing protein [Gemmataceae bacterium]|nr:DUF4340 domain-containing protein [Gemmataceae bacterium]